MPTDVTSLSLLGVSLLCGAAYALFLVRRRPPAGGASDPWLEGFGALALACGYTAGHFAVTRGWTKEWGAWELQPVWIALAALVGGCLQAPGERLARGAGHAVVTLALVSVVIWPGMRSESEDLVTRWTGLLGLGALVLALSVTTTSLARRVEGPTVPLGLTVALGGAAALALFSHYAKFTLVGGVALALLVPAIVVLGWCRSRRPGSGATLVANAILMALLLGGYLHQMPDDRAPALCFVLVGVAPSSGWIAAAGGLKETPRRAALVRLACMSVPVLAALAIAWLSSGGTDPDYGETGW